MYGNQEPIMECDFIMVLCCDELLQAVMISLGNAFTSVEERAALSAAS